MLQIPGPGPLMMTDARLILRPMHLSLPISLPPHAKPTPRKAAQKSAFDTIAVAPNEGWDCTTGGARGPTTTEGSNSTAAPIPAGAAPPAVAGDRKSVV